MWRSVGRLNETDSQVIHHEALCGIFELSPCYDHVDACNFASLDLLVCQIQTTEECLKDKLMSSDDLVVDHYLMSGAPSRSNLCICPMLLQWVVAEAANTSAVLEERRKAREERALLKPTFQAKGKAGGGGSDPVRVYSLLRHLNSSVLCVLYHLWPG